MKEDYKNIENKIFARIKRAESGKLFFPEQFNDFGENTAIRKALQRLVEDGKIDRLTHGIYVLPKESPLIGKVFPGAEEVAAAIAKRDRARIIPTGAQALHILGLSTQVPVNVVYLTDGSARMLKVGKQKIKFKKTVPKNLAIKGEINGLVIQALKAIGKNSVNEVELGKIFLHLKNEKAKNILHDLKLAPEWIRQIMKKALITKP